MRLASRRLGRKCRGSSSSARGGGQVGELCVGGGEEEDFARESWPRSTGSEPSAIMAPAWAWSRCMSIPGPAEASAGDGAGDGRPVEAGAGRSPPGRWCARLAGPPVPVVVVLQAATADALHHQAHVLAGDRGEALDPQDVVIGDGRRADRSPSSLARRGDRAECRSAKDDEVVVVVIVFRRRGGRAGLPGRLRPPRRGRAARSKRRSSPLGGSAISFTAGRSWPRSSPPTPRARPGLVQQVGLVEHHQVGAAELVLEQLLQRGVVIEGLVGLALGLDRFRVAGEAARRRPPPRRSRR